MLGKLIKHEIKQSARYTMVIYAAVVAAIVVMGFSFLIGSGWLGMVSCFALYVVGFATVVVTLVSVIKSFYDSLYSRQGYLSFTLPVKGSHLLLSKIIVSSIWIIFSFAVAALTFYVIFLYGKEKSGDTFGSFWDMLMMSGLMDALPSGKVIAQLVVVAVVILIVTVITYVGYVYFTVTIANTKQFHNHPKLFGGLVFFLLVSVVNTISTKLTEVLPLTLNVTTEKLFFDFSAMGSSSEAIFSYGIGGTIFSGIVAVGLLFATGYIMEHKVNLK